MDRQEAKNAIEQGYAIRHPGFSDHKLVYMAMRTGDYVFEDGVQVSEDHFWSRRTGPIWDKSWSIVER